MWAVKKLFFAYFVLEKHRAVALKTNSKYKAIFRLFKTDTTQNQVVLTPPFSFCQTASQKVIVLLSSWFVQPWPSCKTNAQTNFLSSVAIFDFILRPKNFSRMFVVAEKSRKSKFLFHVLYSCYIKFYFDYIFYIYLLCFIIYLFIYLYVHYMLFNFVIISIFILFDFKFVW